MNLAQSLHLVLPAWARGGAVQSPCLEYESIDLNRVVLQAPKEQAVLVLRPADCEFHFLVVLEEARPNEWIHRSSVPLFAKYALPQASFLQLLNMKEHEILVRNHVVDYGTGILQKNMTIFRLVDGKLRVIFDEAEHMIFAIPTTRDGQPDNTDQSQESTFWLIASTGISIKQIVEKQVVRDHKTAIVRWRVFSWFPELQIFQGASTDGNPGEGQKGTIRLGSLNRDQ